MNLKHQQYLDAKRAGKSVEDCVQAALPGCDPKSERFQNWVATAETDIDDIKKTIELEGLNKPKKAPAKKKPAKTEPESE